AANVCATTQLSIKMLCGAICCLPLLLLSVVLVAAEHDFKLKLHKLEKIKEDERDFESRLDIIKHEDSVKINGELKQRVTLDNDWKVIITIFHKTKHDEEYKESQENLHIGVCDFLASIYKRFLYEKLKDYSNAPHPDTCPLPPEHYHLKDYPFESHKMLKLLRVGHYRIIGKLEKDDEVKIEYLLEFEVEYE
ncbi:hypothetical protein KR093_007986, partial [Drosophila rubida]